MNSDVESLMDKITCLAAPYAPLDGINDAGVSCGIYMSYQGGGLNEDGSERVVATDQNTDKPDLTSTTMLRLILDYASSVDEAIELISSYDLHDFATTSYHYMIADATGRSAILEWVNGTDETDNDGSARSLLVTYSDDDANIGEMEAAAADYQWITNFIIQPGYYAQDSGKAGLDRYDHIGERLSATDGIVADDAAAMTLLSEVGRRTWNANGDGCTVHSAVYSLTQRTMLWVPNEHYDDSDAVFAYSFDKPFAAVN